MSSALTFERLTTDRFVPVIEFDLPEHRVSPDGVGMASYFQAGDLIDHQFTEGDRFCRLHYGAGMLCALTPGKKRRVLDFILPGEFFIKPAGDVTYRYEALVDETVVTTCPAPKLEILASGCARYKEILEMVVLSPVERLQRQILILGRPTIHGKICAFLRDIFDRLAGADVQPKILPIGLIQIANYLSLHRKVVAESLLCLRDLGAIQLIGGRQIVMIDSHIVSEGRNAAP
jgi:hypothetical protein